MAPSGKGDSAAKPATRNSGGSITTPEKSQDIRDSIDGRKFLEKHSLLCPPGEPASNNALAYCLHQISAMSGVPKQAINAIRAAAFLLEDLEEVAINETIRIAFDSQITEFTSDMKLLIEDANIKIDQHIKESIEMATKALGTPPSQPPVASNAQVIPTTEATAMTNPYATALINPPRNVNPILAAKEGIKARQFLVQGLKEAGLDLHDTQKLKATLNKKAKDLGLKEGKIRSLITQKDGNVLLEADSDAAALWFTDVSNKVEFCCALGEGVVFKTRNFNVMALNAPLNLDTNEDKHLDEINEGNDLTEDAVTMIRWAKPIDKRTPHQRTAHLVLSFSNPDDANRAIANGITICNKKCFVEKVRREPIRCLKCQRWNHMAKDCKENGDTCSNCAGTHKTSACPHSHVTRCVSCKSNEHASWSRQCPTFLRKVIDFKERNPESQLPFFPTTDHWTWSTDEANRTNISKANSLPKSNLPNAQKGSKGKNPVRAQRTNELGTNGWPYQDPSLGIFRQIPGDFVDSDAWWGAATEAITNTNQTSQVTQPLIITQSADAGPSNV